MKKIFSTILLTLLVRLTFAQLPCDSVTGTFQRWNIRLMQLDTSNPEIISLHYLFLQDIRQEMTQFRQQTLPKLSQCIQLDYYQTKAQFAKVVYKADCLEEILKKKRDNVDLIFYDLALQELAFFDTINAIYNLDRSLEYNKLQPKSLLVKARLVLAQEKYTEAVDIIHILYNEAELDEMQEREVSDFTLELYEKLYSTGDALAKSGHSADALELFLTLEHFCANMPSGYCNEDYYKGILRSREGVYESYIAIAKEAERRHNMEMARKFYQYDEEYRRQP